MTLAATEASAAASISVPVAASITALPHREDAWTDGVVLGSSDKAAWIALGGNCLVVEGPAGGRLPNAIALGERHHRAWQGMTAAGDMVRVAGRRLVTRGAVLQVVRWWNPRPALGGIGRSRLKRRVAAAGLATGAAEHGELERALDSRDPAAIILAAEDMVGFGKGLTPAGDDVLAGALAATVLLGEAVGDRSGAEALDSALPDLEALARRRTTLLSAVLLGHACAGRVARPVAELLHALTGNGLLGPAMHRLHALGHTSGASLAAGVGIAARALTGSRA